MLVNFLFGFVGVMLFLFVFWRRLRDDYSSEIIFQIATWILVGLSLGLTVARLFSPSWFFWFSLFGCLIGMFMAVIKFKLRFFETLEAVIMAGMPFVSLLFFKDSVTNYSLNSFLAFVASLILIFLAYWFDLRYKTFTWYKSGRIGFAGLAVSILFFISRTVIAILGITMISFVNKFEAVISGSFVLICAGLLIYLGKKE